ncbi:MAG: hypothetical protein AAF732_16150 [Pseudomonadota bacterium]
MLTKLLQFELVLKLSVGLMLLIAPVTVARIFGLPHGQIGLWGRLLGIVLIGIAGAIYIEHDVEGAEGLGLAGLILINLLALVTLLFFAIVQGTGTRRGAVVIWLMIALLFSLTFLEILQI